MGEIDIRIDKKIGRITLRRPQALNALTHGMCDAIASALESWRDDAAVTMIVFDAEGEKAFCAGGDIAEIYRTGRAGDYEFSRGFWRNEYRMNCKLAEFPKPILSLMQGIVMGGGVGIGCHSSHRVVCDTTRLAMPECGIGLIPDVGATRILADAPGHLGRYIALTGAKLDAADAIYAGFADCVIPHEKWPGLIKVLAETGDVSVIHGESVEPGLAHIANIQSEIDALFDGDDVADILVRLENSQSDVARSAFDAMAKASPLSLTSALATLDAYNGGGIREALTLEYRFTHRSCEHSDLLEGIRAAIIDKDRTPVWRNSSVSKLTRTASLSMIEPLGSDELTFDHKEATQ